MGKKEDACQVTAVKDPCWRERQFSMKCLDDNGYDKSMCAAHFENFKQCKAFWMNVKFARRKQGLYPLVPESEEERAQFRKKFRDTGEVPTTA
uniref:Coiled-coil-helix-coiled-coil-helix domain-containing protein 7 n=1 Tax=Pseudodiaptomus poplesia TaxID=213370 RepID=A0A1S6GL30_9MAXI|nr:coiled-coil-helix-coiled-coil-helix domain-containing protein 7 [Pseudodiaptomus poplesia]